jgi:chromosome segregation ATPase
MNDVMDFEIARLRHEAGSLRDALGEARSEAVRQTDLAFQKDAQRAELLRRSAEAKATAARLAAKAEKDSHTLRQQNQALEQGTQKLKQQAQKLEQENQKLDQGSQKLDQENKQIKADKAALDESAKRLKAQLADATREIELLNGRIKMFKNSVSWKITLPIRKIAVAAKSIRPKRGGSGTG